MKKEHQEGKGHFLLEKIDGIDMFHDRPIEREILVDILEAVTHAPSLANSQPWECIVTESSTIKKQMSHSLLDVQFRPQTLSEAEVSWFVNAPIVITIALNQLRAKAKIGTDGADRFGMVDLGGAVIYLLQAAAHKGIGGTIIREFDRHLLKDVLDLPKHIDPVLMVVLGYFSNTPKARPRLHVDEYVHWQTWTTRPEGEK